MAELTSRMRNAGEIVADIIESDIRRIFKPDRRGEYVITVICRNTTNPNAHLVVTQDSTTDLIRMLQDDQRFVHEGPVNA